jgi:hypothetical protein
MKGFDAEVYDSEYLDFHYKNGFGLDGIKQLKKDLNPLRMRLVFRFWKIMGLFTPSIADYFSSILINGLYYVAKDKEFTSESLLNNKDFYDFCEYEGNLLKNESQKWFELRDLYENCTRLLKNREQIHKIISKIKVINQVLDEIIEIEEDILKGS